MEEELFVIPWRQSYRQRCWNNALDPMAGVQNSDIEYSIQVLRKMSKSFIRRDLLTLF